MNLNLRRIPVTLMLLIPISVFAEEFLSQKIILEKLMSHVPGWEQNSIPSISPIQGGQNSSISLREVKSPVKPSSPVIVRISGTTADLMKTDREIEFQNARKAAEWGVGPHLFYSSHDLGLMLIEYLNEFPVTLSFLKSSEGLKKVADSFLLLHNSSDFMGEFSPSRAALRHRDCSQARTSKKSSFFGCPKSRHSN